MLTRFINYCKDSYNELVHKTTWPTMKQLTSQAVLVLSASLLIAVVVFAMDQLFQFFMELIYSL
ncbi:MAG: preprotein translocase subunit SecE [Bacteroidaceae bacterium]|nr:preprotein translocase subunit SecE [Bacteroidales bacterium]MBQ3188476.1 preprotein translocase subunit SecE [Bacteroidaceae bacterium]